MPRISAPIPRSQDVVISNPPFGRRRQDGRAEQFTIGAQQTPIRTSQLDHVIAWRSLEAMKDDGTAVLLIGSEQGLSGQSLRQIQPAAESRLFQKSLRQLHRRSSTSPSMAGCTAVRGQVFPLM
jgi:tRNA1(Val) A37 N6-methylase TrmN6